MIERQPPIPNGYAYMTEIPGRDPVVKMHKSLGQARNAVAVRKGIRGGLWWRFLDFARDEDKAPLRDAQGRLVRRLRCEQIEQFECSAYLWEMQPDGSWKLLQEQCFVPNVTHKWVPSDERMVLGNIVETSTYPPFGGKWVPITQEDA